MYICGLSTARRRVGRAAPTNVFGVVLRVMDDDVGLLTPGAQKIRPLLPLAGDGSNPVSSSGFGKVLFRCVPAVGRGNVHRVALFHVCLPSQSFGVGYYCNSVIL